ncbi:MlaD family protein [Nocardia farcinica]|uniref:MlaD family protein n=1 Tax=Nocardia farcinica TaxID=37329 RepID=UPI00189516B2|nr:MlaD family protein [Nocardia farcinica]MBF6520283.1 MCE family protein [Nocardia farcinica]
MSIRANADDRQARRHLRHGVLGIAVIAIVLGAAGLVAVLPLGVRVYTAFVTDAQSIAIGDSVRVAGLPVGEVTALDLEPDRVRMRFTVDDEVFVGRESSLQVRMLTIVGGHYVALTPAGTEPLGPEPIPADRVALPYSLSQVFQDAIEPIGSVDAAALHRNLTGSGAALAGAPQSLRRMLDGLAGFVEVLDRQNEQISQTLAIVDEYSSTLGNTRDQLARFVASVNRLESIVLDKQQEMRTAGALTVSVVQRIAGLEGAYAATLKPLLPALTALGPEFDRLVGRLDEMLATVRSLLTGTAGLLTPEGATVDHSALTVESSGLCVPVPGRVC